MYGIVNESLQRCSVNLCFRFNLSIHRSTDRLNSKHMLCMRVRLFRMWTYKGFPFKHCIYNILFMLGVLRSQQNGKSKVCTHCWPWMLKPGSSSLYMEDSSSHPASKGCTLRWKETSECQSRYPGSNNEDPGIYQEGEDQVEPSRDDKGRWRKWLAWKNPIIDCRNQVGLQVQSGQIWPLQYTGRHNQVSAIGTGSCPQKEMNLSAAHLPFPEELKRSRGSSIFVQPASKREEASTTVIFWSIKLLWSWRCKLFRITSVTSEKSPDIVV